ncbi:MAG: type 4a pilus biogenesis protein PilO [Phycisphaerales bacterium]|nr:type 4a pilus biogenesis protein PilO [Phycisphaerales bacterium]
MTARTRQITFFCVLGAIPLAAWFFIFSPRGEDIESAMADIASRQARLDTLAEVMAKVPHLEAALEEGERLVNSVEARLPKRQDVEGILERIWQTAASHDLNVRSVKTTSPESAGLYMEQPLDVEMSGSFEGFYRFLLELERMPRLTRVSDLTLKEATRSVSASSSDAPAGSVSARFTLRICFADSVPNLAMETSK